MIFLLGFATKTQLQLSEVAEALLESEDYKPYVNYDRSAVLRAIENTPAEYDELQYGENVTGNVVLIYIYITEV